MISMFAAILCVSALVSIPVGVVNYTFQTLIIILIGLLLRPLDAFLTVLIYLMIGTLGVPVFTTGGGFQALIGPTSGFLLGFLVAAVGISLFKSKNKNFIIDIPIVLLFGFVVIYLLGILYYSLNTENEVSYVAFTVFIPYYFWDLVKLVLAYSTYFILPKEIQDRYLNFDKR